MIFTFYSYKGGVGRTMALANIAEYLYAKGLDVLMIDWDLDSPGLGDYFPEALHESQESRGLLDMLLSYKELIAASPPPETGEELPFESVTNFIIDVYKPPKPETAGRLRLLSCGKRDSVHFSEYAEKVKSFDWADFYESWLGEKYFEWFRREIENLAQIILVDTRSGVTEISGVCTYQLADVVIAFVSSNKQSIQGTQEFLSHLMSDDIQRLRPERSKLNTVVVPARVEQSELVQRNLFEQVVKDNFDTYAPQTWRNKEKSFWDLNIPYIPAYAFEELVAIREEKSRTGYKAIELVSAFTNLWDAMVDAAAIPAGQEPWRRREKTESILLVEGATSWQRLLSTMITSKTGKKCEVVDSLETALSALKERDYLLTILNLSISSEQVDYSGVEILDFLKATGRKMPVVVLISVPGIRTRNIFEKYPTVTEVLSKGGESHDFVNTLINVIREQLSDKTTAS